MLDEAYVKYENEAEKEESSSSDKKKSVTADSLCSRLLFRQAL